VRLTFRPWTGLFTLSLLAGCHNPAGPGGPPPPPAETLAITCPAAIAADTEQAPIAVPYPAPTVSGGTAPVTTTCSAASGSLFPAGETAVTCTATDAAPRTAQCSFTVKVTVVHRLLGTKFLAFGDSLTAGETGVEQSGQRHALFIDPVNNYPVVLQGLLKSRYKFQADSITVENRGLPLETAVDGEQRLSDLLYGGAVPDVLLLLEGTNDANLGSKFVLDDTLAALQNDIRRAQRLGVRLVLLSTLPPHAPELCTTGVACRGVNPENVLDLNEEIRVIAGRENAVLVDAFAAIAAMKATMIGPDGLHLTTTGYHTLAQLFEDAVTANFEQPSTAAPSSRPSAARVNRRR
jgi:lysophospholipase L1-like esterase